MNIVDFKKILSEIFSFCCNIFSHTYTHTLSFKFRYYPIVFYSLIPLYKSGSTVAAVFCFIFYHLFLVLDLISYVRAVCNNI